MGQLSPAVIHDLRNLLVLMSSLAPTSSQESLAMLRLAVASPVACLMIWTSSPAYEPLRAYSLLSMVSA